MLTRPDTYAVHRRPRARQRGVVLVIALIVLVAMMLAGIALVRSVDTTNVIAGNLAFQQAATHSGDSGIEAAIACLAANAASLNANFQGVAGCGYFAVGAGPLFAPAAGVSWDTFWAASGWNTAGVAVNLGADGAGNTVSYVTQRLCTTAGVPSAATCSSPPSWDQTTGEYSSQATTGAAPLIQYRITVRIAGPRATVSYVQSIITM